MPTAGSQKNCNAQGTVLKIMQGFGRMPNLFATHGARYQHFCNAPGMFGRMPNFCARHGARYQNVCNAQGTGLVFFGCRALEGCPISFQCTGPRISAAWSIAKKTHQNESREERVREKKWDADNVLAAATLRMFSLQRRLAEKLFGLQDLKKMQCTGYGIKKNAMHRAGS